MDPADDAALLARVRADVVSPRAHFNHAGMSLTPRPVVERVLAHLAAEQQAGGYEAASEVADELAGVPGALAPLFGPAVAGEEVVAVESATRAWEMILWSLVETFGYGAGDKIVVDQFGYATVVTTLERLRTAHDVEIVVAPAASDGTVHVERLAEVVGPTTRLVAITHMPTHLGTRTDVEGIGRVLAGTDVLYGLDVSQTLGQAVLDVSAIGCDLAFAPGRKFLRAPRGTGALFVAASLAEQLVPLSPGLGTVSPSAPGVFDLPPAARRFDEFEYAVAARLGLGEAARYAAEIGLDRIERLVADRSAAVVEVLGGVPGVELLAGPDAVGIVSFVHARRSPDEIRAALADQGVNVWVNPAGGAPLDAAARAVLPSVRVSPHYLTDGADLDRLRVALRSTLNGS